MYNLIEEVKLNGTKADVKLVRALGTIAVFAVDGTQISSMNIDMLTDPARWEERTRTLCALFVWMNDRSPRGNELTGELRELRKVINMMVNFSMPEE